MSRSIALVSVILVMSVTTPNAEAIRYFVEPVPLSHGYAISGGFIETNTSGPLMEGDITDYQITVEGEIPHIFSPSNLSSSIYIEGTVLATDGQIILFHSTAEEDIGVAHELTFSSSSSSAHCVHADRCGATIRYLTVNFPFSNPGIDYFHGGIPTDNTLFTPPDNPRRGIGSLKRIVVATVPEPSTVTLIFLGVFVFATRMRRKA